MEHEIFHLLFSLPYYEKNCLFSIKTPKKKNYEGEAEGGLYLEYLLFNRNLQTINLREILYILNENNYDKSIIDFQEGFKNSKEEDLMIKGIFSEFNKYKDRANIEQSQLNNIYIVSKSTIIDNPYSIKIELKNDVFGNKPYI